MPEHKKEMPFEKWLELCSAIGFAQGTLRGLSVSMDKRNKKLAMGAVERLEQALKETK